MTAAPARPGAHDGGPLIDTHCHLAILEDRGLLGAALESAELSGVEQLVTVGTGPGDNDRNRELAEDRAGVFFAVGWHPIERRPPAAADAEVLAALARHPRCVGVGEIGLDYHFRPGYHEVPMEVQLRSLRCLLEIAGDCAKPVVVHDRLAHDDVLGELRVGLRARRTSDGGPAAGVLHCFSGDAAMAALAADLGLLCSFAGTVTFPRSEAIQEAARACAADAFVVETDAPFLAPVPHRGRPNLPGYLSATAARVAALRGVAPAAVAAATTRNARRLFDLPEPVGRDRIGG